MSLFINLKKKTLWSRFRARSSGSRIIPHLSLSLLLFITLEDTHLTHTHTHTPIYTPLVLQIWSTNLVGVGDGEGIISCF